MVVRPAARRLDMGDTALRYGLRESEDTGSTRQRKAGRNRFGVPRPSHKPLVLPRTMGLSPGSPIMLTSRGGH